MFHHTVKILALVGLVLFAAPAARATTLIHLDTVQLTRHSDQIVIGRVDSVRCHWNAEHTRIFTDATVRVSETLKGSAQTAVVVTQLGGEIDGIRVTVPGCATFKPGEEALLFVTRGSVSRVQLTGMAQGKFDIRRDARTGIRLVQRRTDGFQVQDVRDLKHATTLQAAPRLELDELVREIRAALPAETR